VACDERSTGQKRNGWFPASQCCCGFFLLHSPAAGAFSASQCCCGGFFRFMALLQVMMHPPGKSGAHNMFIYLFLYIYLFYLYIYIYVDVPLNMEMTATLSGGLLFHCMPFDTSCRVYRMILLPSRRLQEPHFVNPCG